MRVKRTCVRSDRVTAQRQTNELRGGRARISGINRPCQKTFHAKFSTIRQIMVIPDIMESTDPLVPATAIPYVNVSLGQRTIESNRFSALDFNDKFCKLLLSLFEN